MPFCPSCEAEYRPKVTLCTDCDAVLVNDLPSTQINQDMGDVYVCYEPIEASRIANILKSAGLAPFIRDRSSGAFPTNAGTTCEQHIAVLSEQYSLAHQLIEAAIEDNVISRDGHLV